MANINIGVNFAGTPPSGPSAPGVSAPQGGGAGGKPKPGGGKSPGNDAAKAAADAAAREAAARRALTQRMGKTFTDAQIAQVARDFAEMSRSSQRLKRFGGDMEKWINGFSQTFPSRRQSNQHYHEVMQQLGLGSPQQGGSGIGSMLSQAVRGMFRATGAGGGVAGSILQQGYTRASESDGGMGSAGGLGMLGKGAGIAALAYVGIKAVQKVGQQVGEAQDEAVGYHDLREQVGGAANSFDTLREAVKVFSSGLGTTNEQQMKLAKSYAESSQVFGAGADKATGLAVGQGTQLSRGFGLDPESGVGFLAAMKHFKAGDGSDKDNRKLAYLIGDAVGKTGAFSKADDVMNAIAHFAESTSRQSLQVANVEGYAGMMGAFGKMNLPGLDARGSAGLIDKLSGSWGGAGSDPAGAAIRMSWLQGMGGTAWDKAAVDAAGPMATARSTFGADSAWNKTGSDEDKAHGLAMANSADGDTLFADLEIAKLRANTNAKAMPAALMGMYKGINDPEARALNAVQSQDGGLTGLKNRSDATLRGAGLDPKTISLQQLSKLAMIDSGSDADRKAMAEQARKENGKNKLSAAEEASLTKAESSGNTDEIKKALTLIYASRETEDLGKSAREAQVNLENKFKDYAAKIIPLTTAIQEGIFRLIDKMPGLGGLSPEMKQMQASIRLHKKLDGAETAEEKAAIMDEEVAKARQPPMSQDEKRKRLSVLSTDKSLSWSDRSKLMDEVNAEEKERANRVFAPEVLKEVADRDVGAEKAGADARATHEAILNGDSRGVIKNIRPSLNDRDKSRVSAVKLTPDQEKTIKEISGTDQEKESFLRNVLAIENRGNSRVNNDAVSQAGAKGAFQFMPKTAKSLAGAAGLSGGYDLSNFSDSAKLGGAYYDDLFRRYKGDREKMYADYNGGPRLAANAGNTGVKENDDYVAMGRYLDSGIPDKRIPDTARPASQAQVARFNGQVDLNVNYPDGRTEKKEVPMSGNFGRTYAGRGGMA